MSCSLVVLGNVVTMDDAAPRVSGVAVRDGKVTELLHLHSNESEAAWCQRLQPARTIRLLGDQALIPGFVDPHSHALATGRSLLRCSLAGCKDVAELLQRVKAWVAARSGEKIVIGVSYDDTKLNEMRHPTRLELDSISGDGGAHVIVQHVSGHVGVGNTAALAVVTRENELINKETGFLVEGGLFEVLAKTGTSENTEQGIGLALAEYSRHGITTACEAWFQRSDVTDALKLIRGLDLVIFPICLGAGHAQSTLQLAEQVRQMSLPRVIVGGSKLVMDGSIQAYTAFLTRPYLTRPESCGLASYSQKEADSVVRELRDSHLQIHCNGDAAIDMALSAIEASGEKRGRRVTIIHCQTVRDDQLHRMRRLDVHPSFFTSHTYFWGDRHRDIFLGPERASRIDPCRSAINAGLTISNHHDSPVTGVSMLDIVHFAVNRVTSAGHVLGAEQRLTVAEALASVTSGAATQLGLAGRKGRVAVGMDADFAVLSRDPFAVEKERLRDVISVVQTISRGETVFQAAQSKL